MTIGLNQDLRAGKALASLLRCGMLSLIAGLLLACPAAQGAVAPGRKAPAAPHSPRQEHSSGTILFAGAIILQAGLIVGLLVQRLRRRQAELDLAHSNQWLHLLLDNLPVGVVVADDPQCRVITLNPAAAQLLKANVGENVSPIARGDARFRFGRQGEEVPPEHLPLQTALRENREIGPVELEVLGSPNPQVTMLVTATPLRNSAGVVVGGVAILEDISERKRAENALRASEQRYRRLVETAEEGIWMVDEKWVTTFANERLHAMLGHPPGSMVGKSVLDFMDERGRSAAKALQSQREGGLRATHEFRFVRSDGTDLWAIVAANPLLGENGEFLGGLAMVTDITKRKQAEEVLASLYESLKATWEAIPDLVFELDRNGVILAQNASHPSLLTHPAEHFIGRPVAQVVSTQAKSVVLAALAEAARTGRHRGGTYCVTMPDGLRWYELSIAARGDHTASDARFVCLVRDITEHRLAQEALREREEHFRLLASATFEGIAVTREGRLIDANEQLLKMLGYTRQELIGMEVGALMAPEIRERVLDNISAGRESLLEHEVLRKDGSRILVETHGRSTRVQGATVRFTAIRDIGERRQAERALRQHREMLSHAGRVTLLGQLAASLAHELNQPFAAILRNAETAELTLQAAPPNREELRAIVGDIRADSQRGAEVVQRLRSLLKRGELRLEPINVSQLMREVAALVEPDAEARRVSLQVVYTGPGLPLVYGDRVHLQQVLLNLLVNALDALGHAPEGRGTIRLRAGLGANDRIRLEVADSGPGIPEAVMPLLFSPFFTTKPDGLGVGLTICRTIIDAHGGHIGGQNNPDGGAVFWFELPAVSKTTTVTSRGAAAAVLA